jgi:hypothetical protein
MSERPYSRHYHDLIDDTKFADIYPDDHHYATWSRLLMIADQAWPSSAHLPSTARKASVAKLVEVGLVDVLPNGRFRLHGLEAERQRRSEVGRAGGIASGRSRVTGTTVERTFNERSTSVQRASNLEEKRQEETRREDARDPFDDPEADVVTWLAKHGCALQPHSGYYRHVVTMVESHGVNAVVGMLDRLASAGTKSGDVKGYVFGARDALDAQTRPNLADVGKADRADADARAHQARLDRTQRELRALREVGS